MDRLKDPKTALIDLEDADVDRPGWLDATDGGRLDRGRDAAARSRRRVPSVHPRPVSIDDQRPTVAGPVGERVDGDRPQVWPEIESFFAD